jgi:choice-of-anchor A domain-containing protein/uncharacterized repeat protein (TIGR01451 family)
MLNKYSNLFFRVILVTTLLLGQSFTAFAQSKSVKSVMNGTSIIVLSGTADGTTITYTFNSSSKTSFAGVITGTLNSQTQKFYCIDISHEVNPGAHPTYTDANSTPPEITYILNNYFPFKTSYSGILSDINKEAASVQAAIWHFSDGVDGNSITDATIKSRTLAIISDASANNNNVIPLATLLIIPASQSFVVGTPATFDVYALDLNGNPISNLPVTLTTTLGSLSVSSGTTNSNGKFGQITLSYNSTGIATISAKATVQIPQGTRYVDVADSAGKQKLVLATPLTDSKEVDATVEWYVKATCDTKGYTTFTQGGWGSPSNSAPGTIRDQYFSSVFPSGLVIGSTFKLTLTSALAVKNYLPDGATSAAYTQNYTNPTSHISVLSGQLVALKLNVAFSAAGDLGSNSTKLGDLVIGSGPFLGKTVSQFLALAELAIGGGSLSGFTLSQYNDAATSINENFDSGTVNKGFLTCASTICENTIGSYVYHDSNVNGTMDSGELGIAGVVVELVQGTTVLSTATTDVNGKYLFTNTPNGTYTVRISASNFTSGGVFYNTDQVKWYTKNSTSVNTTLNCNNNLSINFGYYKTCVGITKTADKLSYKSGDTITYSFIVENCGDIQLAGGIDVYDALLGMNPYHITVLDPGNTYKFTKTYVTSDKDCGQLLNSVHADGHPVDGSATVTGTSSVTVTVTCTPPCMNKIGDFIWHDSNVNGIQDAGELGIPGVVVELLQGTTVIATTTTDVNGKYLFINLPNGTYGVRVAASNYITGGALYSTAQIKWYTTKKKQGTNTAVDSDANMNEIATTTLNCCDDLTIDFGFYKTCVGITKTADKLSYKSGDTITYSFLVENCGDIQLHGGIDVFDDLLGMTSSNPYHIDVLDPGNTYKFTKTYVTSDKDCGQLLNSVRAEGHPVDGSATVISTSSVTVTVTCTPACLNKLGDFIWHDTNLNGIQDAGELGIPGVVVELLQGTTVIATTTTDVNGKYLFINLPNGTYGVRVAASNYTVGGALYSTSQVKWYSTKKDQGTNNAVDSDANMNEIATTTLNCNDDLTLDFGYYKTCVSITKCSDKALYASGETVTYSFLIENCGDVQLHGGIDIFDKMLNPTGNYLIQHIDVLDAGKSTTFTMTYITGPNDCGTIVNTAIAQGHPVDGSAYITDSSKWTINVDCQQKADLMIQKLADNTTPKCGDNITFTIKVTNNGPNTAKSVQATDLLPAGLIYVSNTASQGSYSNTTGLWTIGDLNNGAFATLTITVKFDCTQANNSTFDLGAAKGYNLFVIQDLNQPSADTQGKVAVGDNATLSNYSIGDQLPANSGDILIVGNDLTYTSGAVLNGNVVYNHSSNLPQASVSVSGGTVRKDNVINFAAAKAYLESLSTSLAAYTVNGSVSFQWGGLTLSGSDPYLNVFTVNGSDLSIANSFTINAPNGSAVLVNINGTTDSWTGGLVVNGTSISNVLYNFYQATSLKLQGINIRGSILAPFAAVNFIAGVQDGQMICKSMTGSGQFNNTSFCGQIPVANQITNVASISSCSTTDPNPSNNSSSATVTFANNGNTGGGTSGGNGGGNWQNVSSFGAGEIIYTLVYSGNNIYAGTMGGKIYKSTNNGTSWTVINTGMNVGYIWSLNVAGNYVFAATELGVYKYDGSTWTLTSLSGKDVHALTSVNGIIYAGTWGYGVYKSSDYGITWTQINNGLGGFLALQSITSTSNGDVYAGTVGGGVFKTTDGTNWTQLTIGYTVIWAMGSSSTTVYAGTYGGGLFKSIDGGSSWTKVTTLDVLFVYSLSIDASGNVFVSSLTNGVFESTDGGASWSALGMGGSGVCSVTASSTSNNILAGTKDGKVFKISGQQATTGVNNLEQLPVDFKLSQNYPNPFNPTTTIEFALPSAGKYALKIYNVIGQEVASLINNELTAGYHTVTFNASRMASGIYIYRLSGSNVNISKKMILMK